MNTQEQIANVSEIVRDYFNDNSMYAGIHTMSHDNQEHIINIGTSILCTKWGIGYEGGGFAQAVVANDLVQSFGRADGTSTKALKFFCQLMYNVGQPSFNTD
jgi:hypothetical protein